MSWLVIRTDERDVHVLPADGRAQIARGHRPSRSCPCRPTPLREGPLDDSVWSHNEPDWPGATAPIVH